MTTPDQQARQMRQETARGQDVNMVKKAINQDKIESFISRNLELRRVAHLESPPVSISSIAYISLVPINSEIVGVRKMGRVGPRSASDVEDPTNAADIVVAHDRHQFLLGVSSYPDPVNQWPFHCDVNIFHWLSSSKTIPLAY